jgi:hypothetical protein
MCGSMFDEVHSSLWYYLVSGDYSLFWIFSLSIFSDTILLYLHASCVLPHLSFYFLLIEHTVHTTMYAMHIRKIPSGRYGTCTVLCSSSCI